MVLCYVIFVVSTITTPVCKRYMNGESIRVDGGIRMGKLWGAQQRHSSAPGVWPGRPHRESTVQGWLWGRLSRPWRPKKEAKQTREQKGLVEIPNISLQDSTTGWEVFSPTFENKCIWQELTNTNTNTFFLAKYSSRSIQVSYLSTMKYQQFHQRMLL